MKVHILLVLVSLQIVCSINIQEQDAPLEPKYVYHYRLNEEETKVKHQQEFLKLVMLRQGEVLKDKSVLLEQQSKFSGNFRMHNYKNIQYTADIGLGNGFSTFKVVLDTGSSNFWIDSNRCTEEGCIKHKQYRHEESQTFLPLGEELSVEFGSGDLVGQINSDTLYFGDLALPQQHMAEIVSENGSIFRDLDFDGILGLAYPTMSPKNFRPFFDNLMDSHKLESNQFAFYFAQDANDIAHSEFSLGGYNSAHVDGDITWHNVVDKYYWMMHADNILVGGKDVGLCPKSGCRVIADTGTSIMSAPFDDLGNLLKVLDVRDHCHEIQTLPNISFMMDGAEYILEPQDYVKPTTMDAASFSELDQDQDLQTLIEVNNWDCIAAFMPLDIQEPQGPAWILGDTFLRKYYSIYDRDANKVGFAKAKK